MRRPFVLLATALSLLAAACSGGEATLPSTSTTSAFPDSAVTTTTDATTSSEASTTTTTPGTADPMFAPSRCPFSEPSGTDPNCGTVTVPQDRADPDGRKVTLAVAVFPPTSGEGLHPPLVYLEGGPGGEILEAIEFAYPEVFAVLNEDRTLVVFDQRGTGFSDPALGCPEVDDLTFDLLDDLIDTAEVTSLTLEALQPCRDRWLADGVDLAHYNSAASARDVADIRRALGYDEWDLFGISYGTRLALTVMRDTPEGVRSVILDSTYPPEIDGVASIPGTASRALGELYEACTSAPSCNDAYGDVEVLLFDTIDMLDESPASVVVSDLFTGERYDAVVDGDTLLGLVFQSLYSDRLLIEIPQMLDDAQQGRYRDIEVLMALTLANQQFFAIGQNFSVQCHEEVPYGDPVAVDAAVEAFPRMASLVDGAFTQSAAAFEFCATWGAGTGDPVEAEPVTSDIPTLVVAGRFDPITPPEFGAAVADRLENGHFVLYPGLGHGVATSAGCPLEVTLAFLSDPTTAPSTSCVDTMPAAQFTVAGEQAEVELGERAIDLLGTVTIALVPQSWEDVGFGAFYRGSGGTDETSLLVQGYEEEFLDVLVDQFAGQLTESGELDEIDPLTVGNRTWRRFSEVFLGLSVELAMWEGDGTTLVVGIFAEERELDTLMATVFIPALESIRVES